MKTKKKSTKSKKIQFYSGGNGGDLKKDLKIAKKAGLTKIDDAIYHLHKTGAKNQSPLGYEDVIVALISDVIVKICTHDEGFAWIVCFSSHDFDSWYKTSPVLSTKKKGKNYLLETENSFYTLERK